MIIKITLVAIMLLFTACSHRKVSVRDAYVKDTSEHKYKKSVVHKKRYDTARSKATHPTMRPYVVHGKKYYPTVVSIGSKLYGRASWYGPNFHGKLTSNGETYNMWAKTAAHKTLPMNTIVKVTNKNNGKSTIVRINDRGPFVASRIIDLSKKAANEIDMIKTGTAPVELEILGFQNAKQKHILSTKELQNGPKVKVLTSYAVQLASFSNIEGAIKTQEKFDGLDGYKTIIKDSDDGDGLFRVWLTGFKSEQEARDFIASGKVSKSFIVGE